MPNKITGATDYLTVSGSVGSYTFQCPNTAPYIAADTDHIWFKTDASQRTTTEAELVGYDLPRTPAKYDDSTPYLLREIIILKAGETLTTAESDSLHYYMKLPIYWDGVFNDLGFIKGNRPLAQQYLWTPEAITVTDADGNVYNTVVIGTQTWLRENLKTTKYRDGSAIPNITSAVPWTTDTTGAYCWYGDSIANKNTYGALYNWYAVNNAKGLAPTGYHIPTLAELITLSNYLGGDTESAGHMKESGTTHWDNPNVADNSSGMTMLGGSYRASSGNFVDPLKKDADLWTSSQVDAGNASSCLLHASVDDLTIIGLSKIFGFSVRCIKD